MTPDSVCMCVYMCVCVCVCARTCVYKWRPKNIKYYIIWHMTQYMCICNYMWIYMWVFRIARSILLRAILNKSWQQHPTRHQLYGHLPPITKTIQVRWTRHAGHCWRSRDELIRDVLLWIPTHGRAKAGWPARTYIQQLCEDTGCCPEDLPRAMNDREEWRERVRDIRATSAIMMMMMICGRICIPVYNILNLKNIYKIKGQFIQQG